MSSCESTSYNPYHTNHSYGGDQAYTLVGIDTGREESTNYELNLGWTRSCGDTVDEWICKEHHGKDHGSHYRVTEQPCQSTRTLKTCIKTSWDEARKRDCCLGLSTDTFTCAKYWTPFSETCKKITSEYCSGRDSNTGRLKVEEDSCEDVKGSSSSSGTPGTSSIRYGTGCKTWCETHPEECASTLASNCIGKSLDRGICLDFASKYYPDHPEYLLDSRYYDFCSGSDDTYEHPESTIFYFEPATEGPEVISSGGKLPFGKYKISYQVPGGSKMYLNMNFTDVMNKMSTGFLCLLVVPGIFEYSEGRRDEEGSRGGFGAELDFPTGFLSYHEPDSGGSLYLNISGSKLSVSSVAYTKAAVRMLSSDSPNSYRCVIHFYPDTLAINYVYTLEIDYPHIGLRERLAPSQSRLREYCECFRTPKFYENYFDSIKSQLSGSIPQYPDCYYQPCALSSIPTSAKKQGLKTCPNLSQCIQVAEIGVDGSIEGDINISQNQDCSNLSLSTTPICGENEYIFGSSCVACPEGTVLKNNICEEKYYDNISMVLLAVIILIVLGLMIWKMV